jgi:hypothetical protein
MTNNGKSYFECTKGTKLYLEPKLANILQNWEYHYPVQGCAHEIAFLYSQMKNPYHQPHWRNTGSGSRSNDVVAVCHSGIIVVSNR